MLDLMAAGWVWQVWSLQFDESVAYLTFLVSTRPTRTPRESFERRHVGLHHMLLTENRQWCKTRVRFPVKIVSHEFESKWKSQKGFNKSNPLPHSYSSQQELLKIREKDWKSTEVDFLFVYLLSFHWKIFLDVIFLFMRTLFCRWNVRAVLICTSLTPCLWQYASLSWITIITPFPGTIRSFWQLLPLECLNLTAQDHSEHVTHRRYKFTHFSCITCESLNPFCPQKVSPHYLKQDGWPAVTSPPPLSAAVHWNLRHCHPLT